MGRNKPGFAVELPWLVSCLAGAALAVGLFVAAARDASPRQVVPPLDDVYIYFQYARSIAEGHPFRYHAADEPSSGASSPIYALLLALFYLLGWKGASLLWPATAFGTLALGLSTHFLSRLASRLAGHSLRIPVIIGTLGWGWLTWHVASGMEGALTLLTVAYVFDRAHLWITEPRTRTRAGVVIFILLALVLPLIQPAAIFVCGAIGVLLFAYPTQERRALRWLALPTVGSLFAGRVFWSVVSGQSFPNGAAAKWLLVHPAKPWDEVAERIFDINLRRLGGYFFGIKVDSAEFYVPPIVLGTCVVLGLGWVLLRRRSRAQIVWACFPWAIVGGFAGLMTYGTYSQHFFRYTAPFAPMLFAIGLVPVALLARGVERRVGWLRGTQFGSVLPLLVAGSTLVTWPMARAAFIGATRDIAGQHILIASAVRRLPRDSIVAVTDAGALAYLGGHRTIDLIGLTTNRASNYYLSGAGSQLEFVESLPEDARPTHYATYRGRWYHPSMLFGRSSDVAELARPTIVGGHRLELWPLDQAPFGIGAAERPLSYDVSGRRLLDALDVADYDQERAHRYVSPNLAADNVLGTMSPPGGEQLVEGGRRIATEETIHLRGRPGRPLLLVARVSSPAGGEIELIVNGRASGSTEVAPGGGWTEVGLPIDGSVVAADNEVVVRRRGSPVTSYHFWVYSDR